MKKHIEGGVEMERDDVSAFARWEATGEIPASFQGRELLDAPGVYELYSDIPEEVARIIPEAVFLDPVRNALESVVVCVAQRPQGLLATIDGIRNSCLRTYISRERDLQSFLDVFLHPYVLWSDVGSDHREVFKIFTPPDICIGEMNALVKSFHLRLVRHGVPLGLHNGLNTSQWEHLSLLKDSQWLDVMHDEIQRLRKDT